MKFNYNYDIKYLEQVWQSVSITEALAVITIIKKTEGHKRQGIC